MYIIYLLAAFVCCFAGGRTLDNSDLIQVNMVYRHGDRSPIMIFPKDPNPITTWPNGLGWLSEIGIREHFELGKWIRKRYDKFLSSTYNHTEIHVTSSDEERCLMSAESNLAGLYYGATWNPDLKWHPVPVHTRPMYEDKKLIMGENCPKYNELLQEDYNSSAVRDEEERDKDLYNFLKDATGWTYLNATSMWQVYDITVCEKAHNLTTLPWLDEPVPNSKNNKTVWERVLDINYVMFRLLSSGKKNKFHGGPLLKEYIGNMQDKINSKTNTKFLMHSGHDTTVAALLTTLGLYYDQKNPPYAAMVSMELRKNPGTGYYINVYYKNTTDTAYPLTIPGCDFNCPWEKFKSLTKSKIPDDWEAECGNEVPASTPTKTEKIFTISTIMAIILGVLLLVVLVALVMICITSKRKSQGFLLNEPGA